MAKAKTKKVDIKKLAKVDTMNQIQELFEQQGISVSSHDAFGGMTDTTIVIHLNDVDVQVKLITPSNKVGNRYLPNEE